MCVGVGKQDSAGPEYVASEMPDGGERISILVSVVLLSPKQCTGIPKPIQGS